MFRKLYRTTATTVVQYLYLKKIIFKDSQDNNNRKQFFPSSYVILLRKMELSRRTMDIIVHIPSAVGLILAGVRFNASDIMLSQCD